MPGKKVLIIDDEVDLCYLLQDYFRKKNYDVVISHTLNEGADLLKKDSVDILFLDNNLPDGIGWNLAPGIATDFPGTYIVLISAFHPSAPNMPEGAKFRMIEKPVSMADLNKHLAEL